MAYLSEPQETIAILQKYHFNFQKKFGQNFLIDGHVVDKIIAAAGITKEDVVLEIGPGIGTMTQRLCEEAGDVIAVEIDSNLIPILRDDTCRQYDNLRIIHGDILKVDVKDLLFEYGFRPVKVVANLPYYITTPILMGLLEARLPIESITVMVQKEVADRMETGPGSKDYGALSLAVQYFAEPYIAANVPPNCFMPRPNVGSAVIRLTLHDEPPVKVRDEKLLFALIRASFNQRRKTLVNGLTNAEELSYTKEDVTEALAGLGFSPSVRGETLTLADFAALADALKGSPKENAGVSTGGTGYPENTVSLSADGVRYPGNTVGASADETGYPKNAGVSADELPPMRLVYAAPPLPKPSMGVKVMNAPKREGKDVNIHCEVCGRAYAANLKNCPECGYPNSDSRRRKG